MSAVRLRRCSAGAATQACALRQPEKMRDFPSERLTCSYGFGIIRPPLPRGGKNPDL